MLKWTVQKKVSRWVDFFSYLCIVFLREVATSFGSSRPPAQETNGNHAETPRCREFRYRGVLFYVNPKKVKYGCNSKKSLYALQNKIGTD